MAQGAEVDGGDGGTTHGFTETTLAKRTAQSSRIVLAAAWREKGGFGRHALTRPSGLLRQIEVCRGNPAAIAVFVLDLPDNTHLVAGREDGHALLEWSH